MSEHESPSDKEMRVAMFKALEQMFLLSEANTRYIASVEARLAGHDTLASSIDDNEDQVHADRWVAAQKEVISHIYEKSHQYVAVIIAGGFAAYFTTLGILYSRFSDRSLLLSALLMTISLTVFVFWEVVNISYIGYHNLKGDFGTLEKTPGWMRIGWPIVMGLSVVTALPAVAISVSAYLRMLGVTEYLSALFQ